MGELTGFTRSYLASAPASPWTWADEGRVLCWRTGRTIAFLPEVRAVLARVAREAEVVPPFLAVALLLHALREDPRGVLRPDFVTWIRAELGGDEASPRTVMTALVGVAHLERGLAVFGKLPHEFWLRREAKELVAAAVFEAGCVRRDPSHAALLARALEHGLPPWSFAPREELASRPVEAWNEAISVLLHGLARFEPERFLLRVKTGLEHLPAPAELELEPGGGARALIDELRDDPELGEVARFARALLATLALPRPIAAREDLPIGGVSDIANRGSFERLLASELAHDDLTLAVRIALNEALYTRRESPPLPLTGARLVLLDAGIRMWGRPRVLAAAVGLALVAGAERSRPVRVWRAGEERLEPVDLGRREGLVSFLSALDCSPHPGASVERFLAELSAAEEGAEAFLVTHERVLADPDFRVAARELADALVHTVLLDGEGNLRVEARAARGARTVHAAKLDLAALLGGPAADPVTSSAHESPAFLRILPSPLRLPHELQQCSFARTPDGSVVAWTLDQELALWTEGQGCARRLAHLPGPRRVWHFECTEDGVVHVVKSDARERILWFLHDLRSGENATADVTHEPAGLFAVTRIGTDILLACRQEAWLVEGAGSPEQRSTRLAGRWLGGRYFRTREHAVAVLRLSAAGPGLEPFAVALPEAASLQSCFERAGSSQPWALARSGKQFRAFALGSAEGIPLKAVPPPGNVRFTRSSDDGLRILDHTGRWLLDLQRGLLSPCGSLQGFKALSGSRWCPSSGSPLRNRLGAVGRGPEGELVLTDRRGRLLAFRLRGTDGTGAIDLAYLPGVETRRLVPFERASLDDPRITGQAVSRRGDHAYVDRRGLLHLVPAERTRPQTTVVLAIHGAVAVWNSDERVHGPFQFTGMDRSRADGGEMLALLQAFAEGFA